MIVGGKAADEKAARGGRRGIARARAIVCLAVFASIVIGLMLHAGWGTISSMGIGALSYLCPLGALQTIVASHTFVPRVVVSLVVVLVFLAVFGRVFCAWVCPVPPIERFFRPSSKRRAKHSDDRTADVAAAEPTPARESTPSCASSCQSCSQGCALAPVGGKRDGFRLDSRHGVLAGALVGTAIFGFPVFCLVCPVGLSIATVIAVWRMLFVHEVTWSVLVFPAIVIAEVVLFKKWCHRLCPLGALMSLVGQRSTLFRPKVGAACLRDQGIDCHACVEACPELLDPHASHIPECTRCGACVEACPAHAITMRPAAKPSLPTRQQTRSE